MATNDLVKRDPRIGTIRQMIEQSLPQIQVALPRHMTAERMQRVAMTAIQKTPALLQCTPLSLIGAIVEASQLGLEPDGALGHAYLVPFGKQCQLIPGYRGMVDLSRRSGQLSTIFAQVVYKDDEYHIEYGLEPKLTHVPSRKHGADEDIVAAYAVAVLRDGGRQFEWLWRDELNSIRDFSKARTGPWQTHFPAMARKTAIRRLWKLLPVSAEMQRAATLDEQAAAGLAQDFSSVLGGVDSRQEPLAFTLDDLAQEEPETEAESDVLTGATVEPEPPREEMRQPDGEPEDASPPFDEDSDSEAAQPDTEATEDRTAVIDDLCNQLGWSPTQFGQWYCGKFGVVKVPAFEDMADKRYGEVIDALKASIAKKEK